MMNKYEVNFFLSALSPSGFSSYFPQAIRQSEVRCPIYLKAGPGCGKSTLLRRLADDLCAQEALVEHIRCSGDPDSLDGVFCPSLKVCAIDATEPHAIEAKYPVAVEQIVSLYDALDHTQLQRASAEIMLLFDTCRALTQRAARYITAAGSLLQDTARVALCFTDLTKARTFARTLSKRYLPMSTQEGQEHVRLLSAVTLKGVTFFEDTIATLADEVVVLHDAYGAASKTILQELRSEALAKHYNIITCYCSMSPFEKVEHLFIPSLGLAFVTSNAYHSVQLPNQRNIHCTRFCCPEGVRQRTKRLKFNQKAIQELLAQAASMLAESKEVHDVLEGYYKEAIDFSTQDLTYAAILETIVANSVQ